MAKHIAIHFRLLGGHSTELSHYDGATASLPSYSTAIWMSGRMQPNLQATVTRFTLFGCRWVLVLGLFIHKHNKTMLGKARYKAIVPYFHKIGRAWASCPKQGDRHEAPRIHSTVVPKVT